MQDMFGKRHKYRSHVFFPIRTALEESRVQSQYGTLALIC